MAASGEGKPDIILNSPVGNKHATYTWPLTYTIRGQKIDGAEEIIETIRWVAREYPEFKSAIEHLLSVQPDYKSYDSIKSLCDKYNKITDYVMKMNKGTSIAPKTSSRAPQNLLKMIIQQVYNDAVSDPNDLNKYSPFSSETYGETSFEFMAQLIDRDQFRPKEDDVFIDLGSGVGHLVLQMAASVKCKKCYGIEIADVPAGFAKKMEEKFKFWMNWHGKTYTEFELFHGDFFDKKYAEIIKSATYILVNNFAFKPDVDHKLKQRFLDLKDGTQILSSKSFCLTKPKSRVTERDLTDIGSIMNVRPIQPDQKKDSVSWTHKPLPYYLHILDGIRVERYYEKQKRRQGRSLTEKGRPSKRRKTVKAGSDSYSDDSDDNIVYGPTTRKAWSEWCNASSMNASNRTSADSGKTTSSSRNNSTDTENLYDVAIEDDGTTTVKSRETESPRKDKKLDTQNATVERSERTSTSSSQENSAQSKNSQNLDLAPKSCLDKKRDYAIKKGGTSFLQNALPSALYSISKPAESTNGSTSALKIPNIVIKVKPTIEAKVVSDNSSSNSSRAPSDQNQPGKINDENGKKLRQRKKSVVVAQIDAGSSNKSQNASKNESKTAPTSLITTNGARVKKATTSGVKASSRATNNSKKKAASPDKSFSLDLLHAKTVESVTGDAGYYSQPAPGCADHSLTSIVETPSLPKVVIKDLSMFISAFLCPKNTDKFVSNTKQEFEKFVSRIQQPNTRDILQKCIEQERLENRRLHREEEELTREVKILNDRIPKLMKVHCDELGIKNSHRNLVTHLGALLKKHQDLTAYQLQLEATLQPNQRTMNPPAAHSHSGQNLAYRLSTAPATLDLSIKQGA